MVDRIHYNADRKQQIHKKKFLKFNTKHDKNSQQNKNKKQKTSQIFKKHYNKPVAIIRLDVHLESGKKTTWTLVSLLLLNILFGRLLSIMWQKKKNK